MQPDPCKASKPSLRLHSWRPLLQSLQLTESCQAECVHGSLGTAGDGDIHHSSP